MAQNIGLFALFYPILGMIMLIGVWSDIERDYTHIYNKPRSVRITMRLCVMVLWPVVVVTTLLYVLMKIFYKVLTD